MRQLEVSNVAFRCEFYVRFPNKQTADRVVVLDAVEQLKRLLFFPNEFSLELRNLDLAAFDVGNEVLKEWGFPYSNGSVGGPCANSYHPSAHGAIA